MHTQTIYKSGNSLAITIPKHLLKELELKAGAKINIHKNPLTEELIISKTTKTSTHQKPLKREFQKWLDEAIEENEEILDQLAVL